MITTTTIVTMKTKEPKRPATKTIPKTLTNPKASSKTPNSKPKVQNPKPKI